MLAKRLNRPDDEMPTPHELMQAAIEITAAAESIPLGYYRADLAVEDKADESPVTIADRETEKRIREEIAARFPEHGIFGEEFGKTNISADFTWIIDPIDGTRSFICGVPLFGMLLGVMHNGEAVAGLIRMPALGEVFAGARGVGATFNGEAIRCRPITRVDDARIYLNEASQLVEQEPERLKRLMSAGKMRRFSNDCYSFALVASGRVDAVIEIGLQPYDYLPVAPVIEAAGGVMTDWQGAPLGLDSDGKVIAAATKELHAELLKMLA